ncbi:hypothetical protein DPMN_026246 [Dreissena polymorpha]|uniref:Uncharacterized protein n=1 Tax=Dreissena polymorpha TaxID=45954 RepID=A0A9D4RCE9_DREPO|nr:hypothetical protein DPMN_026246 [Dreissena polymorpha]
MNVIIERLDKEKGQTNVVQQFPQNGKGNPGETCSGTKRTLTLQSYERPVSGKTSISRSRSRTN